MNRSWDKNLQIGAWIMLALSFVLIGYRPIRDGDVFMYLALARDFFVRGHFVTQDPFIFPVDGSHFDVFHEWASYFVFYGAFKFARYAGISILMIGLALLIWTPAAFTIWRRRLHLSGVVFFVVLSGMLAFSWRYLERSSLLAEVLLASLLAILIADRRGVTRVKWLMPLILLIWINIHGSFPLGFILGGIWLLSYLVEGDFAKLKSAALVLVTSLSAVFINPLGYKGVLYPLEFLQFKNEYLSVIVNEWTPTLSRTLWGYHEIWSFLVFLVLASVLIIRGLRFESRGNQFFFGALLVVFTYFGISSNRFVSTAAIVLTLVVVNLLQPKEWGEKFLRPIGALISTALLVFIISGRYPLIGMPLQLETGIDARLFPTANLFAIRNSKLTGTVWNSYGIGCYLAWMLDQKRLIAIHGFVTDVRYIQRYFSPMLTSREKFDEAVIENNVDTILIDSSSGVEPFAEILKSHPEWAIGGVDDASVVFVKREGL